MTEPVEHDTPAREAKMMAEAQKAQAEAEYFRAKTHGQMVDNETATALSISAGIAVKRESLKDQWDAASNGRNRAYHFTDNVSTDTVEAAVDVFNRWQRLNKDNQDPYRLIIC